MAGSGSSGLVRRAWRLLDAGERRRFVALALLSVAMGIAALLGVAAVVPFIGVVADPALIARHAALTRVVAVLDVRDEAQFIVLLGVLFVALVILGNAINLVGSVAVRRFSHDVAARLQVALFDEYLRRDGLFHARHDAAVLAADIVHGVDSFALGILQNLLSLVASVATCVLILAAVFAANPVAAFIVALPLVGTYVLTFRIVRRRVAENGRTQSRRWNERARLLAECLGAAKEVLLMRHQRFFRTLLEEQSRSIARTAADTIVIAQSPRHVLESLAAVTFVVATLWLSRDGHAAAIATLSLLAVAAYRLLPALQLSFASFAHLSAERAGFDRLEPDLLAATARAPDGDAAASPLHVTREIRIDAVSFAYAPHRPPALHQVSLRIPAGTCAGLVGPNGSGKTTLADVIVGLLKPQRGAVFADDRELDEPTLAHWQAGIAYVPQSICLLNASVARNIAFGLPEADIDRVRLREAAENAQLMPWVSSLPQGFSEMLGDDGLRPSGGQRQLIGIARALYRRAAFLVLDEATNALDADNERGVVAALRALRPRPTVLIIAHFGATLRECELIFELDSGALVGEWSAREWLARAVVRP